MISILTAGAFFAWLGRAVFRRPAFLLVGLFLIWQFFLKVLSAVYIDVAGPVLASEVGTDVGGEGSSAPLLIAFVAIPLVLLYLLLAPRTSMKSPISEPSLKEGGVTFADLVVWILRIFVVLLYVDMLRIGGIPFFARIDRFEYQGGVFHDLFTNYVFLISFVLGYVYTRSRIVTGAWDLRCVWLMVALFFYLFLAGHRFGAFYVMVSFFLTAFAAFYYSKAHGWPVAPTSVARTHVRSRVSITVMGLAAVGLVVAAMINNLIFVRGYENAGDEVVQRLFVQPIHLYWLTWDRLRHGEMFNTGATLDFMFNDPLDATRNTGMQYLMVRALGEDKALMVFFSQGQDYAGGYPEILIELGGLWVAFVVAIVASLVTAFLYRLCIVSLSKGHFLSSVFAVYVCYGPLGFFVGGMMNFVLAWTYLLKIALLLGAMLVDRHLELSGRRLLPWVVFPRHVRP